MSARNLWAVLGTFGMTILACASKPGADFKELDAGDPAPAFALPGSDGATHRLEDFRGKRAVVLAWFPKAFTGG